MSFHVNFHLRILCATYDIVNFYYVTFFDTLTYTGVPDPFTYENDDIIDRANSRSSNPICVYDHLYYSPLRVPPPGVRNLIYSHNDGDIEIALRHVK